METDNMFLYWFLSKANSSPRCSFFFRWSFWETLTVWTFESTVTAGYWTPHFKLFCSWYFRAALSLLFAEKDASGAQQSKPSKSSKQAWRSLRVRPAPARQPREDGKDRRHPFALYGSGEKDADIAGRKTHNVCPAASTHEVTFLPVALWVCMLCCEWAQMSPGTDGSVYFPGRSMNRLYVLRPGGRWSGRSRPKGTSAGEPSLPILPKPQRWFKRNSTHGSLSTCAASLYVPDRTHTHTFCSIRMIPDKNTKGSHYCLSPLKFKYP